MNLEKLVILTEFFPPNNGAAANRVFSWAISMVKYGYYPVIFCKNSLNDDVYFIEKRELYEVHYVKCDDPTLQKKRIYSKNVYVRKAFGMLHYFFVNSIKYNEIKNIEKYASHYIQENGVKKMVATAPGYSIFGLASILAKKFPIKWIADYRDDWTTSDLFSNRIFRAFGKIDSIKEKKYLENCTYFTSVSNYYIRKINMIINKKGFLVENGFNKAEILDIRNSAHTDDVRSGNDKFMILYPGSLYSTQKLDIIGVALKNLPPEIIKRLEIIFLGTQISGVNLPKNCRPYLDTNLLFMKRVSRSKSLSFSSRADAFLLLTHTDNSNNSIRGIPSSKLYEFISSRKNVLVCPSDNDIVAEKLKETTQGIFCNSGLELSDAICKLFLIKANQGCLPLVNIPEDIYYKNTREYQAGKLAAVLDLL